MVLHKVHVLVGFSDIGNRIFRHRKQLTADEIIVKRACLGSHGVDIEQKKIDHFILNFWE